jgi:hypothetical protein
MEGGMSQKRFRLRFTFWLDMHKKDEALIAEQIESLKADRTFASTVREGICLICDLRAGRLDVLLELFPFVAERLKSPSDSALQARIDKLETLLLAHGNFRADVPRTGRSSSVFEPMVSLTETPAKANAETIAKNFLTSARRFWD